MDRLDAVKTAKQYIADLYAGESITKPRLEELNRDRINGYWLITVGFAYLEGNSERSAALAPTLARAVYGDRVYKLVRVDDGSGEAVGMTDRLLDPSLPS